MQGADSRGSLLRVGEAVEQLELTQGFEQPLMLVLAVDFDQRVAEPLEQRHRDRRVVDERPVSSRARQLTPYDHLAAVVAAKARLVEHRARRGDPGEREHGFHGRGLGIGPDDIGLSPGAAQQEDGVDQDGLAGPGLAREHVQTGSEGRGDGFDDGEVLDPQLHAASARC